MGYKHSPANAKLSAFMQKMNNTSKSPSLQLNQQMAQNKANEEAKKNMKVVDTKIEKLDDGSIKTTEFLKGKAKAYSSDPAERAKQEQYWKDNPDKKKEFLASLTDTKVTIKPPKKETPKDVIQEPKNPQIKTSGYYHTTKPQTFASSQKRQVIDKDHYNKTGVIKYKSVDGPTTTINATAGVSQGDIEKYKNMSTKEMNKQGVFYTTGDDRSNKTALSGDESRKLDNKLQPLSEDYEQALTTKTALQDKPSGIKMMKKHSDRFASPARQEVKFEIESFDEPSGDYEGTDSNRSGQYFRPSKEIRKSIRKTKKEHRKKLKQANKDGTLTPEMIDKKIVHYVGMPKGIDAF